ncbi:hypothetical protein HDU92_003370 [Lobulomyces angularis]|nr:hypothetical protein HDU92_003370 [Lobulomyces angularis]
MLDGSLVANTHQIIEITKTVNKNELKDHVSSDNQMIKSQSVEVDNTKRIFSVNRPLLEGGDYTFSNLEKGKSSYFIHFPTQLFSWKATVFESNGGKVKLKYKIKHNSSSGKQEETNLKNPTHKQLCCKLTKNLVDENEDIFSRTFSIILNNEIKVFEWLKTAPKQLKLFDLSAQCLVAKCNSEYNNKNSSTGFKKKGHLTIYPSGYEIEDLIVSTCFITLERRGFNEKSSNSNRNSISAFPAIKTTSLDSKKRVSHDLTLKVENKFAHYDSEKKKSLSDLENNIKRQLDQLHKENSEPALNENTRNNDITISNELPQTPTNKRSSIYVDNFNKILQKENKSRLPLEKTPYQLHNKTIIGNKETKNNSVEKKQHLPAFTNNSILKDLKYEDSLIKEMSEIWKNISFDNSFDNNHSINTESTSTRIISTNSSIPEKLSSVETCNNDSRFSILNSRQTHLVNEIKNNSILQKNLYEEPFHSESLSRNTSTEHFSENSSNLVQQRELSKGVPTSSMYGGAASSKAFSQSQTPIPTKPVFQANRTAKADNKVFHSVPAPEHPDIVVADKSFKSVPLLVVQDVTSESIKSQQPSHHHPIASFSMYEEKKLLQIRQDTIGLRQNNECHNKESYQEASSSQVDSLLPPTLVTQSYDQMETSKYANPMFSNSNRTVSTLPKYFPSLSSPPIPDNPEIVNHDIPFIDNFSKRVAKRSNRLSLPVALPNSGEAIAPGRPVGPWGYGMLSPVPTRTPSPLIDSPVINNTPILNSLGVNQSLPSSPIHLAENNSNRSPVINRHESNLKQELLQHSSASSLEVNNSLKNFSSSLKSIPKKIFSHFILEPENYGVICEKPLITHSKKSVSYVYKAEKLFLQQVDAKSLVSQISSTSLPISQMRSRQENSNIIDSNTGVDKNSFDVNNQSGSQPTSNNNLLNSFHYDYPVTNDRENNFVANMNTNTNIAAVLNSTQNDNFASNEKNNPLNSFLYGSPHTSYYESPSYQEGYRNSCNMEKSTNECNDEKTGFVHDSVPNLNRTFQTEGNSVEMGQDGINSNSSFHKNGQLQQESTTYGSISGHQQSHIVDGYQTFQPKKPLVKNNFMQYRNNWANYEFSQSSLPSSTSPINVTSTSPTQKNDNIKNNNKNLEDNIDLEKILIEGLKRDNESF